MMQVFAVTMVKNEQDIIRHTIQNMLKQVDQVIVADNMSTDNTRKILESFHTSRLSVIDDFDPAYEQSRKMTNLANMAMNMGADVVVPFDADEYWHEPNHKTIKQAVESSPAKIFPAVIKNFIPTGADDDQIDNPFGRIQWRRHEPAPLVKVAGHTAPGMVIEMGNHNITYPEGFEHGWEENLLEVRHYPYRTPEQFVNKAVQGGEALALTDLPYEMGQHWRGYSEIYKTSGEEALKDVFLEWFYQSDPETEEGLIFDPL